MGGRCGAREGASAGAVLGLRADLVAEERRAGHEAMVDECE